MQSYVEVIANHPFVFLLIIVSSGVLIGGLKEYIKFLTEKKEQAEQQQDTQSTKPFLTHYQLLEVVIVVVGLLVNSAVLLLTLYGGKEILLSVAEKQDFRTIYLLFSFASPLYKAMHGVVKSIRNNNTDETVEKEISLQSVGAAIAAFKETFTGGKSGNEDEKKGE